MNVDLGLYASYLPTRNYTHPVTCFFHFTSSHALNDLSSGICGYTSQIHIHFTFGYSCEPLTARPLLQICRNSNSSKLSCMPSCEEDQIENEGARLFTGFLPL